MLIDIQKYKDGLDKLSSKKKFTAFVLISVSIFFVFLYFTFSLLNGNLLGPDKNSVPNDGPGDEYNKSAKQLDEEFKAVDDQSYRITQLISKLPYRGKNFSLSYDYESGEFILILNQNNTSLATSEFDQFLTANSINKALIQKDLKQQNSISF